jgi:hypothetical protein
MFRNQAVDWIRGFFSVTAARRQGDVKCPPPTTRAAMASRGQPPVAIYGASLRHYSSLAARDERYAVLSRHLTRLSHAVASVDWKAKMKGTDLICTEEVGSS